MKDFAPSLEDLREQGLIFYEVVAGSVAYGLNTPDSDEDLRGYYHVPLQYRNGLTGVAPQANDAKHDITFYNLKRTFDLLMTANPNQIELLWIPDDCVRTYNKAIMDDMMANRHLFISKASYNSHFRYAKAQIGKAKGQNKWVNNPKPKEAPKKEDFCWYIDVVPVGYRIAAENEGYYIEPEGMPCRPQRVSDIDLDLSKFHCAKLEHAENMYRLYAYDDARGVFRGKNQLNVENGMFKGNTEMLICESIPIDDEWDKFKGFLIYNEQAYKRAFEDWKEYWKWMKNRNEKRWLDQESGKLDYDAKNMSHCMRLMLSSKHILTEGYPIVRFEGETKDLLMNIKKGELEYAEIMEMVDKLQTELEVLLEKTSIPDEVDFKKLNTLYTHLNEVAERELV